MICYRLMTEADVFRVSQLEQTIFTRPWSETSFMESLHNGYSSFFVAEEEKEIVGYAGLHNMAGDGEITNVAVSPDKRKCGIAYEMLLALMDYGKKHGIEAFTLEVRAGNEAAIRLYEKLQFNIEGIRKNFYEKPTEDAMVMWKR